MKNNNNNNFQFYFQNQIKLCSRLENIIIKKLGK